MLREERDRHKQKGLCEYLVGLQNERNRILLKELPADEQHEEEDEDCNADAIEEPYSNYNFNESEEEDEDTHQEAEEENRRVGTEMENYSSLVQHLFGKYSTAMWHTPDESV
ncbi:uncharacterized protein RAG0_16101 [Rhynchosporium agropyri]|uniref:Uncharacterized protein n=1 Tax=Rhynchosporium agropyri TaxID=914238 RepID=A0A1E1LNV3_9HELO|nr:uncharacterized protein RAG0_16101 [Rhynchosporium agropyri]